MIGLISLLITGALVLLFISAALAPIESLGWYAGWFGEREAPPDAVERSQPQPGTPPPSSAEHFVVYLSGIGAITSESVPEEEIVFLNALEPRLTGTVLVRDVFPYAVASVGLTGERFFARIWRWLEQRRLKNPGAVLANLVNIRNMLQVTVNADQRYGPVYSLGVAQGIVRGLVRHGYVIGSSKPVTLIGWSGGGQFAIGASTFLLGMIAAPIRVISIGGVMSADPGLLSIVHLYHFYGDKDPVQNIGAVAFPGRWKSSVASPWNRAMAAGRITLTSLGPFAHNGKGNYFDIESRLPNGQTYAEKTMEAIIGVMTADGLLQPARPAQDASDLSPARLDKPATA